MDNINIALTRMLMSSDSAVVADACAIQCLYLVPTINVPTAATDGVVLLYNPLFVASLTIPECIGLLVHEMCHVRFKHTERFNDSGWIDRNRANKSMDMEINPTCRNAGYKIPEGGCWPDQIGAEEGLSWEEYFTLHAEFEEKQQQNEPPAYEDGLPTESDSGSGKPGADADGKPDADAGDSDAGDSAGGQEADSEGSGDSENSGSGAGDSKPEPGEAGSDGPDSGSGEPGGDSGSNQAQPPTPGGQTGSSGPQKPGGGKPVEPGVHAPGSLTAEYAPELLEGDCGDPEELADEVQQQVNDFEPKSRVFDPAERKVVEHQAGSGAGSQTLGKANLINVSPDCRWQDVVIDMIASRAAGETVVDWSRPSRRSHGKFYQPSRRRVSGYKLALILDVSGSCVQFFDAWQAMAREMVEHVREITELEILYHDTSVTNHDTWLRRSGEEVTIESNGGGGTDFRPVLKLAESLDVDGAVLFTDSEGPFPDSFCLDCVTVQPPGSYVQTPFGTTIRLTKWE